MSKEIKETKKKITRILFLELLFQFTIICFTDKNINPKPKQMIGKKNRIIPVFIIMVLCQKDRKYSEIKRATSNPKRKPITNQKDLILLINFNKLNFILM